MFCIIIGTNSTLVYKMLGDKYLSVDGHSPKFQPSKMLNFLTTSKNTLKTCQNKTCIFYDEIH